jgi:hypothetical protein
MHCFFSSAHIASIWRRRFVISAWQMVIHFQQHIFCSVRMQDADFQTGRLDLQSEEKARGMASGDAPAWTFMKSDLFHFTTASHGHHV